MGQDGAGDPGVRVRDVALLSFFTLFWLAPVVYHGLNGGTLTGGIPVAIFQFTNVTCLFAHSTFDWPVEYIEAQTGPGLPWIELPEPDYFRMEVFGHQTRLRQLAQRALPPLAFHEAAGWVRARYAELHPGAPPLFVVRFVVTTHRPDREAFQEGWKKPPLAPVPLEARRVWYTRVFEDGLDSPAPSR
jgi:hypothetical protein